MEKPTQRAIYDIFYAVRIRVICHPDKPWERSYVHPLDESLINQDSIWMEFMTPPNCIALG